MNIDECLENGVSLESYLGNDLSYLYRKVPEAIIQQKRQIYSEECGLAISGYRHLKRVELKFQDLRSRIAHLDSLVECVNVRPLSVDDDQINGAFDAISKYTAPLQTFARLLGSINEAFSSGEYEFVIGATDVLLRFCESTSSLAVPLSRLKLKHSPTGEGHINTQIKNVRNNNKCGFA
ncbi:hypothetical protein ACOME3_007495 [Neoechinorhynchus agilis]